MPFAVLVGLDVRSWDKNREVDNARVNEIAKSIVATKRVVGIIYLAELNGVLSCFDGNHRRLALRKADAKIENVLVMIMWDACLEDVVAEFNNINLAVSVSSIHLECGITDADKIAIRDYATKMVNKYPLMVGAARCIRPNFNRDLLEEDIVALIEENEDLSVYDVQMILNLLNKQYASGKVWGTTCPLKPEIAAKCRKYGLWLFCEGRTIDRARFAKAKSMYR